MSYHTRMPTVTFLHLLTLLQSDLLPRSLRQSTRSKPCKTTAAVRQHRPPLAAAQHTPSALQLTSFPTSTLAGKRSVEQVVTRSACAQSRQPQPTTLKRRRRASATGPSTCASRVALPSRHFTPTAHSPTAQAMAPRVAAQSRVRRSVTAMRKEAVRAARAVN